MKLYGIGSSDGISISKVLKISNPKIDINDTKIQNSKLEIEKFKKAIETTSNDLKELEKEVFKKLGSEEAAIFQAHLEIANDPMLIEDVQKMIENEKVNAVYAVDQVGQRIINIFSSLEDEYMKERVADIKDVITRIIKHLSGIKNIELNKINKEVILVAQDITPSETAQMNKEFIKGFATDIGGKTSHAAIMARNLEIPAVLGLQNITNLVNDEDTILLDGTIGEIIINPSEEEIKIAKEKIAKNQKLKIEINKFRGIKTLSKDKKKFELVANIGNVKDCENALKNDAEGVGLFRTEFLYMDSKNWPTEEEQFQVYKNILSQMKDKLVIARTLDIGGDKKLDYYQAEKEDNPFLGLRAIRLCLDKLDVFKTQLRALIRASSYGKLAIMFPMIATMDELNKAKQVYKECCEELKKENIPFSKNILIGIMVEIPSTVIMAKHFAKHVDFFSIGTNDLMQYSMAYDRINEKVSYLYQPLNPSILRMIKMTIDASHKENKWTGVCGEMAGDLNVVPFLIGMGLDEFSMSSTNILKTRYLISKIDSKKAKRLVRKALTLNTESEVKELLKSFNKRNKLV